MSTDSRPRSGAAPAHRVGELVLRRPYALVAASIPALCLSLGLLIAVYRSAGSGKVFRIQGDFQVYRWAVHTWLAGGDILGQWAPLSNGEMLPWVYPPFALLALTPFALLPLRVGVAALWAVDLAVLGMVLYLVVRHVWPRAGRAGAVAVAAAGLPLALLLEPVHACFAQGQINIALMGLVTADCLVRVPRWPRGMLVGIAAAIKLMPAVFLLYFLLRKDFRAAVTGTLTAVVCTLLGFAVDFGASMTYWFRSGPAAPVAGHSLASNQSVLGALARLELPPVVRYGLWAGVCLVLAVALARTLRYVDPPLGMTLTGLFALLVSPTSWSNHWVWLVPGVVVLLGSAVRLHGRGRLVLLATVVLVAVTAPFRVLSAEVEPVLLRVAQHLVGNAYVLIGAVCLLLAARAAGRGGAASGGKLHGPQHP